MTAERLFKKLKEEPRITTYSVTNNSVINFYSSKYSLTKEVSKYITEGVWKNIGFNIHEEFYAKNRILYFNDISYEDKQKIEDKHKESLKLFWNHLDSRKEEIIKILEKRVKQVNRQDMKTKGNQQEKIDRMLKFEKTLTELGYQVSKVAYSNGWGGGGSYNRIIPDKWHKYISTPYANVKFATVEVKINQKDYKLGCKIGTSGQIGCSFEDLKKVYLDIEKEYNTLEEKLR